MSNRTERLDGCHEHLQAIYERYPLARVLVESAGQVKRVSGYNRSSVYYALNDWLMCVFGCESREMREVLWVIDQLLPQDHPAQSVYRFNPPLPGLPPLPERRVNGRLKRWQEMRTTLEVLCNSVTCVTEK